MAGKWCELTSVGHDSSVECLLSLSCGKSCHTVVRDFERASSIKSAFVQDDYVTLTTHTTKTQTERKRSNTKQDKAKVWHNEYIDRTNAINV